MSNIIVVLCEEENERTGEMETVVSHGVDMDTMCHIALPCVSSPSQLGAKWDVDMQEWILRD
jgi:hypothetical protein